MVYVYVLTKLIQNIYIQDIQFLHVLFSARPEKNQAKKPSVYKFGIYSASFQDGVCKQSLSR